MDYTLRSIKRRMCECTLKFGYSFMYIVIMPTYGRTPRARPTTSSFVSHSCPGAYRPLSSTELLSPLVRNFTVPFSLLNGQECIEMWCTDCVTSNQSTKYELFMYFQHPMHNWNVSPFDFENNNLANAHRLLAEIGQK